MEDGGSGLMGTQQFQFWPILLLLLFVCFPLSVLLFIWFSCDVIAAMLLDENKRCLISSFCSSTSNCTLITSLLSVSLEIG